MSIYIYIYMYTYIYIYGNLPLLRKRRFCVRIFHDESSAFNISVDGRCISRKICSPVIHVAKGRSFVSHENQEMMSIVLLASRFRSAGTNAYKTPA